MTMKKTGLVILDPQFKVLIIRISKDWELPVVDDLPLDETISRLNEHFVLQSFKLTEHMKETDKMNLVAALANSSSNALDEYSLLKDARFATLDEIWHLVKLDDPLIGSIRKLVDKVRA